MKLSTHEFNYSYRSNYDENQKSFYNLCMKLSTSYDRAAGYFSSSIFRTLADGLSIFINENNGHIRMVVNPELSQDDIIAIENGLSRREEVVESVILNVINQNLDDTEKLGLQILSYLIHTGHLEMKVAFSNKYELYHEKFGVFSNDDGFRVAFIGSSNESHGGIQGNFEKLDVFTDHRDASRISGMSHDFDALWYNNTEGLIVQSFSKKILDTLKNYNSGDPFIKKTKINSDRNTVALRDYQKTAINELKINGWNGILEMATGTGKTFTSLFAVKQLLEEINTGLVIIIVPFLHLSDQWRNEIKKVTGFDPILCNSAYSNWRESLNNSVRRLNAKIYDVQYIVTVYNTASSSDFLDIVKSVKSNKILIADECHKFGAPNFRKIDYSFIDYRIGLSATPQRWYDDVGSNYLNDYFGGVVYSYSLEEAIENGKLSTYYYNPIKITPTFNELDEFARLTSQIGVELNKKEVDKEKLKYLYRKRTMIIAKAERKVPTLISILKEMNTDEISHTLVYCAQGDVDLLTREISKLGIRTHRFNHQVPLKDRTVILNSFAEGTIQVLVAIKCLDEGIDVPSTKTAYFLASTSNPREFVQRRGRILRKHESKEFSEIFDFIVLPTGSDFKTYEQFAVRELPRFSEFANSAINNSQAKSKFMDELVEYNLNGLMYKGPWEVYEENRREILEDESQ